MNDLKIGDRVLWFRQMRNHRTRFAKVEALVASFTKKQRVMISLKNGERRAVSAENLQVCR